MTCIVTPVSILVTLYWRGVRSIWLFMGLVMVCVSIAAIGVSGFGIWYAAQPHVLNLNGPTPLLEFEVKPPTGQSLETLADVEPEVDTDRNTMPGYWHTEAPENSGVRAGYVRFRIGIRPKWSTSQIGTANSAMAINLSHVHSR